MCHKSTYLITNCLLFFNQFLQDTLDTLFGILDENSQKYGSKVFDCLVSFVLWECLTLLKSKVKKKKKAKAFILFPSHLGSHNKSAAGQQVSPL